MVPILLRIFQVMFKSMCLIFSYIYAQICKYDPKRFTKLAKKVYVTAGYGKTSVTLEDFKSTIFEWKAFKVRLRMITSTLWYPGVEKGEEAPNFQLENYKDQSKCQLKDLQKSGRPLVLNFGSCTCPPFMAKLAAFKKCVTDYAHIADFITIYISEAHPTDGWALDTAAYAIPDHQKLENRLTAAGMMYEQELPCPLLVDLMTNEAELTFAAHPERLAIIHEGKIAYIGGQGPFDYKTEEVVIWLEEYSSMKKTM